MPSLVGSEMCIRDSSSNFRSSKTCPCQQHFVLQANESSSWTRRQQNREPFRDGRSDPPTNQQTGVRRPWVDVSYAKLHSVLLREFLATATYKYTKYHHLEKKHTTHKAQTHQLEDERISSRHLNLWGYCWPNTLFRVLYCIVKAVYLGMKLWNHHCRNVLVGVLQCIVKAVYLDAKPHSYRAGQLGHLCCE